MVSKPVRPNAMSSRAEQLMVFVGYEPKMWDDLGPNFMNHLEQVNADLKAAGLPQLGSA